MKKQKTDVIFILSVVLITIFTFCMIVSTLLK